MGWLILDCYLVRNWTIKLEGGQNYSATFDLNLGLLEVFSWKTTLQKGPILVPLMLLISPILLLVWGAQGTGTSWHLSPLRLCWYWSPVLVQMNNSIWVYEQSCTANNQRWIHTTQQKIFVCINFSILFLRAPFMFLSCSYSNYDKLIFYDICYHILWM